MIYTVNVLYSVIAMAYRFYFLLQRPGFSPQLCPFRSNKDSRFALMHSTAELVQFCLIHLIFLHHHTKECRLNKPKITSEPMERLSLVSTGFVLDQAMNLQSSLPERWVTWRSYQEKIVNYQKKKKRDMRIYSVSQLPSGMLKTQKIFPLPVLTVTAFECRTEKVSIC